MPARPQPLTPAVSSPPFSTFLLTTLSLRRRWNSYAKFSTQTSILMAKFASAFYTRRGMILIIMRARARGGAQSSRPRWSWLAWWVCWLNQTMRVQPTLRQPRCGGSGEMSSRRWSEKGLGEVWGYSRKLCEEVAIQMPGGAWRGLSHWDSMCAIKRWGKTYRAWACHYRRTYIRGCGVPVSPKNQPYLEPRCACVKLSHLHTCC